MDFAMFLICVYMDKHAYLLFPIHGNIHMSAFVGTEVIILTRITVMLLQKPSFSYCNPSSPYDTVPLPLAWMEECSFLPSSSYHICCSSSFFWPLLTSLICVYG